MVTNNRYWFRIPPNHLNTLNGGDLKPIYIFVGALLLAILVPAITILYFSIWVRVEAWIVRRRLECLHGKKPHQWSLWKAVMPNSFGVCTERYCLSCGTVEKNHNHQFRVINIVRFDCEPIIEYCRVCGFVNKTDGTAEHDYEAEIGFEMLHCSRCNKEYSLL